MPLICYDLRFPVFSKNNFKENAYHYDLLIYVANWPAVRENIWATLLQARAIENSCYTIGLNRIGKDGLDVSYNGHSGVVNPKGEIIYHHEDGELIKTIVLKRSVMDQLREKFPVHLDADNFKLTE